MQKITVIGDIMVEPPLLESVKTENGYDFSFTFAPLKELIRSADYAIGNLETPLAGEQAGYTDRIVSFNAPDSLAYTLKDLGLDMVTTANNHALDRGLPGLYRTIDILDAAGLAHTGTYKKEYSGERIHYFTAGDTKVAVISYTYGTNLNINGVNLEGEELSCVNLLRPMDAGSFYRSLPQEFTNTKKYFEELLGRPLTFEETVLLKKAMGITVVIIDDVYNPAEVDEQLKPLRRDYEQARQNADIVIFCPHIGGQFNVIPGKYTEYVLKSAANMGFDVVLAAHAHTTQKAELIGKCRCFFSLGNVTMVPSTFYSVPECLPNYGIAVHLYVEKGDIQKTTFSVFKMVESENKPLQAIPTEDIYNTLTDESEKEKLLEETREIYERVTQKKNPNFELKTEYEIF